MNELKNIVLKLNDILYFADGRRNIIDIISYDGKSVEDIYGLINQITKIERPVKYETIYEAPKQILTKEEKEWLKNYIGLFKDKFIYVRKRIYSEAEKEENLLIAFKRDNVYSPFFEKGTMFQGMELNKEYTLKELGLFEE